MAPDEMDVEIDRLMRLSYADLRAEFIARGEDPDKEIAKVTAIIDRAKADAYRRAKDTYK